MFRRTQTAIATVMMTAAALALPALAAAQMTGEAPDGKPASISFADHGGIKDWEAEDRDTLRIQARDGTWYVAEMMSPCFGLAFKNELAFVTEPTGSLNKFSSVIVDGNRCFFKSFTKTEES